MNKLIAILLMVTVLSFVFCSDDSNSGDNTIAVIETPEVVGKWACSINSQLLSLLNLQYDDITITANVEMSKTITLGVISNEENIYEINGTWSLSANEDTLFLDGNDASGKTIPLQLPVNISDNNWIVSFSDLLVLAEPMGIEVTPALKPLITGMSLTFTKQQ